MYKSSLVFNKCQLKIKTVVSHIKNCIIQSIVLVFILINPLTGYINLLHLKLMYMHNNHTVFNVVLNTYFSHKTINWKKTSCICLLMMFFWNNIYKYNKVLLYICNKKLCFIYVIRSYALLSGLSLHLSKYYHSFCKNTFCE